MTSSTAAPTRTSRQAAPKVAPARRGGLHLTARGQLLLLLALVLLLLGAFAVGRSASSQATEQIGSPALSQVTVQPGDTLWSIARTVAPQRDPRDVVAQIRRLNHMSTATVQAGRQLVLPAAV